MRGLWLRQNEQVQVRTGLSSGGFESRRRTWMLPQWHPPEWSMIASLCQPPYRLNRHSPDSGDLGAWSHVLKTASEARAQPHQAALEGAPQSAFGLESDLAGNLKDLQVRRFQE